LNWDGDRISRFDPGTYMDVLPDSLSPLMTVEMIVCIVHFSLFAIFFKSLSLLSFEFIVLCIITSIIACVCHR